MEHVELLTEGTGDISNKLQYIEKKTISLQSASERYTRATYNIVSYLNKKDARSHSGYGQPFFTNCIEGHNGSSGKACGGYLFICQLNDGSKRPDYCGRKEDKDNTLKKLEHARMR